MKIKGTVVKYNQASGIIKDENNISYIFTRNNIKNAIMLKENDEVIFLPEKFNTVEVEENIATFIEKV